MLKTKLITVAILALCQGALAAQPPSAGSQIQQIPASPMLQKSIPDIRIEPGNAPAAPETDTLNVLVKSLHVTGHTLFSEADLVTVTGFQPDSELRFSDLRSMALKIADYYHRNGYFVAQAYLPAQEIKDGEVTIAVIEGHYGDISLNNRTNFSDNLIKRQLDGINSGDVVAAAPLETRLLLLSDFPGVDVKSTLTPGASVGTADLIVDVIPGKRITGSVDADNAGNRYTGEYRLGATVNFNEPTGNGDVATLRAMTSGAGLKYLRASYQAQFGKAKGGVAYTVMDYRLGRDFDYLAVNGTARIASIYGSYPLLRSRNNSLYAQLGYDDKTFQDKVDSTSTITDKKARVWMASLIGDHRDRFGGGGWDSYSVTWSDGNLDMQSPLALATDRLSANANGHYSKLSFNAARLQNLSRSTMLYGAIYGQFASKNLDISEKMELGGMNAVRAYPEGESYGDQGYVLTLEARLQLSKFSERLPDEMQLIGFVDTGTVTLDKNPWTVGSNRRTRSGLGVGFNWMRHNNFMVKAFYAHKLGNAVATSAPDESGRFWIQLVKYF